MNIFLNKAKSQLAADSIMGSKATDFASMVVTRILVLLIVGLWLFSGINAVQAQEVDLESGLVAYYPFNGNANDESGNGNHGEVNGATLAEDRNGETGKAYSFDGKNSSITVTDSKGVFNFPGNVDFTMSLWALIDEDNDDIYLLSKNDGKGGNKKWILGTGDTIKFDPTETEAGNKTYFHINGSGAKWLAKTDVYEINHQSWQHYLLVKSGNKYKMYLEGNLSASEESSAQIPSGILGPLSIGRSEGNSVKGKLDDIRFYNRALSKSEITALYKLESQPDPLTYQIEGNSVTITDCEESFSGLLIIPSNYNGKPVTSIGAHAIQNCGSLTRVTIPASVTSIGRGAFSACESLTSISIPQAFHSQDEASRLCLDKLWPDDDFSLPASKGK